jgi:hypothetical protein
LLISSTGPKANPILPNLASPKGAPADRRFKLGLRALLDGLQLESSKKRKRAP